VLFGATGDLAHRKIVPALFALHRGGELPSPFGVLATSTSVKDAPTYRADLRQSLERFEGHVPDAAAWDPFASSIDTVAGDYTKPEAFRSLRAAIEAAEAKRATAGSRLFYLAVPPPSFPDPPGL
jgi:glucose-6-phosphate 1-dehydrogenase